MLAPRPRRRRRTVAIVVAGLLALGAWMSATATATAPAPPYLALGDSIVYGLYAGSVGYPDIAADALGLHAVDAACPGEAATSLLTPAGADNGCRAFKRVHPLHVDYGAAPTQMAFATEFLRDHLGTRLVTLGLGVNDGYLLARTCGTDLACLGAGLASLRANVDSILSGLRATGYGGVIEVVDDYATDGADAGAVAWTLQVNAVITASAAAHGAVIADAFAAFQAASARFGGHTCGTGLLNAAFGAPGRSGGCDIHPTPAGQRLLARVVEQAYRAAIAPAGAMAAWGV